MGQSSIYVLFQCSHHHNTLLLINVIVWFHVRRLNGWNVKEKKQSFILMLTQRALKKGLISWIIKCSLFAVSWNWDIESIPKGPRMNSETKWNGILIHVLLCHWNIYVGCYKSTWQILETTWKPQEIFYPCSIYGNSGWQKIKQNSEFRANVQYLLTWWRYCYLKLNIYYFAGC